jgi:hypothetical protein
MASATWTAGSSTTSRSPGPCSSDAVGSSCSTSGRTVARTPTCDGALLAYWLARNSRFARDLAALPEGVEAIVLPPGERPEVRYDDFSQSEELIEQGYRNTARFLSERADRLAADAERRSWRARIRRLRLPVGPAGMEGAEQAAADPAGAILGQEDAGDDAPSSDGADMLDPDGSSGEPRPAPDAAT